MSLEQLFFIALFILVPLVRALAERRNKQRAEKAEELFETTESSEHAAPPSLEPPAWYPPPFPSPLGPPAPAPFVPSPPIPTARPPAPEAARRPSLEPARSLRTARARTRAAVPRDRAGLRRAFLLVEILGPPRALETRR